MDADDHIRASVANSASLPKNIAENPLLNRNHERDPPHHLLPRTQAGRKRSVTAWVKQSENISDGIYMLELRSGRTARAERATNEAGLTRYNCRGHKRWRGGRGGGRSPYATDVGE